MRTEASVLYVQEKMTKFDTGVKISITIATSHSVYNTSAYFVKPALGHNYSCTKMYACYMFDSNNILMCELNEY